jgi:hypothetical protein
VPQIAGMSATVSNRRVGAECDILGLFHFTKCVSLGFGFSWRRFK